MTTEQAERMILALESIAATEAESIAMSKRRDAEYSKQRVNALQRQEKTNAETAAINTEVMALIERATTQMEQLTIAMRQAKEEVR